MSGNEFRYITYIKTAPERLWQALTDPADTRRYWGMAFSTDWKAGSAMDWEQFGVLMSDPAQVVLEAAPSSRLAYTWHTITPEFAAAAGFNEAATARLAAERRSTVGFDIEPVGEIVKLTVAHSGFDANSMMLAMVSEGWPAILSSLKTLLETGEPLPDPEEAGQPG